MYAAWAVGMARQTPTRSMAEPVQDASPLFVPISQSDRPEGAITVTGDVAFARQVSQDSVRTQWRIHLKLTNISDEPILAYQIAVEAMPDVGLGVTHLEDNDLFFERDVFEPGTTLERDIGPSPIAVARAGSAPARQAFARATLRFVEFADGRTVGQSNWGASLRAKRNRSIGLLKSFLGAYQRAGYGAMNRAVVGADTAQRQDPSDALQVIHHVKYLSDSAGPAATVRYIRTCLASAEERESFM